MMIYTSLLFFFSIYSIMLYFPLPPSISIIISLISPDTSKRPDVNCFRNTTRFPLNLPANKINTVPGVIVDLSLGALRTGVGPFFNTTSSAG